MFIQGMGRVDGEGTALPYFLNYAYEPSLLFRLETDCGSWDSNLIGVPFILLFGIPFLSEPKKTPAYWREFFKAH